MKLLWMLYRFYRRWKDYDPDAIVKPSTLARLRADGGSAKNVKDFHRLVRMDDNP
ncbi:MAG: hypothetical protein QF786_00085 [Vicinamibacterales bacterium]|jgi:hypothetical protein|nr:hypothetical protein [Vicinamibacterales bacterium]